LLAVDGVAVESTSQLATWLESNHQLGDTVQVTLLRDGRQFEVSVELAEDPSR
jgi:S1-C subfamily serine protease